MSNNQEQDNLSVSTSGLDDEETERNPVPPVVTAVVTVSEDVVTTKSNGKPVVTLPTILQAVGFKDLKNVIIGKMADPKPPKDEEKGTLHDVGISLYGISLTTMRVDLLRKLCGMLSVPKYKAQRGFTCLKLVAYAKIISANPDFDGTNENKDQNTKFRCLNAIFHDDNFDALRKVNDKRTRLELDEGKASKNNFLNRIAAYHNDAQNNDSIGDLVTFAEDRVGRIDHLKESGLDLRCFNMITSANVQNIFDDTKKKWNKVMRNMEKSGTHDNEPWNFCERNGGDLVYYFLLCVKSRGGPESIKEKLQVDLTKDIFFCSVNNASEAVAPVDNDNDDRVKRTKQSNLKIMETVAKTSEEQIKAQRELAEQNHKIQLAIADKLADKQTANANMIANQIKESVDLRIKSKQFERAIKAQTESLHQAIKKKEAYELKAAVATGEERTLLRSYVDEYKCKIKLSMFWLETHDMYHMADTHVADTQVADTQVAETQSDN